MKSLRRLSLAPVALAALVSLSACSASGTPSAAVGGAGAASAVNGGVDAESSGAETDTASDTEVPSLPTAAMAPNAMSPVNSQVRVVDMWVPQGASAGADLDVWAGRPDAGGIKITTVRYGTVSEFFAPLTSSTGGGANVDYELDFYTAGKVTDADHVIDQTETSAPQQKLTMAVMPREDTNSTGGSLQVFADDIGPQPSGSGFTKPSIPKPPSGKALVAISASAMQNLPPTSDTHTWAVAGTDGKCLEYLDPDTGTVHTDPDNGEILGGTTTLDFVVEPGASLKIVAEKVDEATTSACARTATVAADPQLAAGGRAFAFLYGTSLTAAKVLVVPSG